MQVEAWKEMEPSNVLWVVMCCAVKGQKGWW